MNISLRTTGEKKPRHNRASYSEFRLEVILSFRTFMQKAIKKIEMSISITK